MSSKTGKIHLQDIRQGKTVYVVHGDFPLIEAGMVGNGEVTIIKRMTITRPVYLRTQSNTRAFDCLDRQGNATWINVDAMLVNHALTEVNLEGVPYFVVLDSYRALRRFLKHFDDRPPTASERARTLLREAGLNAKQRPMTQTPYFQPRRPLP